MSVFVYPSAGLGSQHLMFHKRLNFSSQCPYVFLLFLFFPLCRLCDPNLCPSTAITVPVELLGKDILKAYVIFSQYILSRLCIILHGSLWVQLHGRVLCTVLSKMRAIMTSLSGCVGERTEGKRGTVTFSTKHCLSLLHTAEKREMCLYHYLINRKITTPVVSSPVEWATTALTQALITVFTFHLEVRGHTLRIKTHRSSQF